MSGNGEAKEEEKKEEVPPLGIHVEETINISDKGGPPDGKKKEQGSS